MAERTPGIIVRTVDSAGIIAPPAFERYPLYLGEGDPYRSIENQLVVRSSGSVDNLVSISTIHEIISVGDLPDISKYVDGVDYTLSAGNIISWLPGGSKPTLGNPYYIAFTETRAASAYDPMLYFDENLIYADHGNKTRTSGVINDVSVGSYLGLQSGAKGVMVAQLDFSSAVDPDSPTGAEFEAAITAMITKLEKIYDYKLYIVPMSSGTLNTTTAATMLFNHAVLASQPERKQERSVYGALPVGTTYQQSATFAQTYANSRMIVPYAYNGISRVNGFTSDYDMRFYNAAVAGLFCAQPIGRNISDEVVPNVTIYDNLTPDQLNWLVARGVSPAKIKGDIVRNVMLITTDTTSALTEDLGVQDTKDYVKKYWREKLWEVFRNKPINAGLLGDIDSASRGILEYLVSKEILADWNNVSVGQDGVEPRKVNVSGSILPAYGLQWMDVTFTFVLSF